MPPYLSPDAKSLISAMLAVDPVKRITIPEITQHPFFTSDLPRYLTPLPPPPGPVLGTLSSLVSPPKQLDFEIIEGLGRIEEDVVEELATSMIGVDKDDVWECLRRDDGVQGNAVKVAYMLLRDKRRLGKDLAEFAEAERDAQLAAMDPRNTISPTVLSPVGAMDLEENPFEVEFNAEYDDEEGEEEEDELDFISPPLLPVDDDPNAAGPQFAVLNSSLPDQLPEQHHLTSYVSAKRSGRDREKKQQKTKWHFGIRSRSPPMEVMLEIYRTLKTLGMEWKEKKNLGGLGGLKKSKSGKGPYLERNRDLDGDGGVDLKAASSIYFVETRARVQDVVVRHSLFLFVALELNHTIRYFHQVLMNLQLYMVDSINYLVDFHHKKSYRASTDPSAGRFDMAVYDPIFSSETSSESGRSVKEKDGSGLKEDEVVSPFVFMDVACRLILELAGGNDP